MTTKQLKIKVRNWATKIRQGFSTFPYKYLLCHPISFLQIHDNYNDDKYEDEHITGKIISWWTIISFGFYIVLSGIFIIIDSRSKFIITFIDIWTFPIVVVYKIIEFVLNILWHLILHIW